MKKIGLIFLKGLFIMILFAGTSVTLAAKGLGTVNSNFTAVTGSTVVQYLESIGYQVFQVIPIYGTNNWIAITRDSNGKYWITTVYYSSANSLLGHENDTL